VLGGPYHITATLSPSTVLSNYSVTNAGANFTINTRLATWTTDPNSKTYGDADPNPLTTGSGSGFLAADNVTATYTRAAGETVLGGPYHVTATLSPAAVLSNYSITNAGASFTINTRPATWTTNPNSKTYGNADPNPLTTGSGSNFVAADGVTATYTRAAGETVLGGPYHITATLNPSAVLSNYSITNAGADFTINTRLATWTTNPNSKVYGASDPNPLTTGSGSGFLAADNVTATYTRAAGELPGTYHITATLSPAAVLSNYNVTNNGATFSIGYGICSGPNPGGVILPPINSDGTSVYKRQGGSTIPVKFTVCDVNGNPISDPNAVFAGTGGQLTMLSDVRGQVENINEVGGTDIPDAAFRWSNASGSSTWPRTTSSRVMSIHSAST
jgi:hypothetical protein